MSFRWGKVNFKSRDIAMIAHVPSERNVWPTHEQASINKNGMNLERGGAGTVIKNIC